MLELKNICKSYNNDGNHQVVLKNINLKLSDKGIVSIVGKSGSGKTTLLNIIGSLDKSDFGEIIVDNKNIREFSEEEYDSYRNKYIGFIFQNYNLLDHRSALDNIKLKLIISSEDESKITSLSEESLKKVGLYDYKDKLTCNLSGGEKQRVAIARVIASNSKIILCDEPTGALDNKTSTEILNILKELSKDRLIIMVTHNMEIAKKYSNRIITMQDGEIINDTLNKEIVSSNEELKLSKTKLDIKTIFNLALNNLKIKKKRNILLSLTASIGIIGISIILSISNGFNDSLNDYKKYISNKIPIIISPYKNNKDNKKYINSKVIRINKEDNSNYINNNFITYYNNINKEYISYSKYNYLIKLNLIQYSDKYYEVDDSIFKTMPSNNIRDNYDILEGRLPSKYNELLLEINSDNSFSKEISKALNINDNDSLDSVIGRDIKLVLNDNYYIKVDDYYNKREINKEVYDNKNNISLKIVGIIKVRKDKKEEVTSNNAIYYKDSLVDYIINKNKTSNIVNDQKNKNYNLLTRESLIDNDKNDLLCLLGKEKCISSIFVYPSSYESKDKIINSINKYNNDYISNKVSIIDESKIMYDMSIKIIDIITIVLICFSSISLIVSSIMIGIITYISVLERKKEIGILRSMGSSKKDIKFLFIMENVLLGFSSGIVGIFISIMSSPIINTIFKRLLETDSIFLMKFSNNIMLILLSISLSVLGAYIPSKKASDENIITSLESI